jgi:uncharacterized protein
MNSNAPKAPMLTAQDVLQRYKDEDLPEFVEIALEDVNQRGNFGNMPLHVACIRNNLEEIKALLAAGADANAVGELGSRPLHECVGHRNTEAVSLLICAGAETDVINEFGQTPVDLAAESADPELLAALNKGAH